MREFWERPGPIIRKTRRMLNMTQKELATQMGITQTYIADIEGERTIPSSEKLLKFMDVLQIADKNTPATTPSRVATKSILLQQAQTILEKSRESIDAEDLKELTRALIGICEKLDEQEDK